MSLLDPADPSFAVDLNEIRRDLESGTREDRALLLNLREEHRLRPEDVRVFQEAAIKASGKSRERIGRACLGLAQRMRLAPDIFQSMGAPKVWFTHHTWDKLQRYCNASDAVLEDDSCTCPRKTQIEARDCTYWVAPWTNKCPDEVCRQLGLALVDPNHDLYRIDVDINESVELFIPLLTDAGCYPAWRCPPEADEKWHGRTRDLVTDDPSQPELLVRIQTSQKLWVSRIGRLSSRPPNSYLDKRIP
jgi:hypothetical protein